MGCLYALDFPNGKRYLGISSKTAEERWQVHLMRVREGRAHALQNAIRKYGADNVKVSTLVVSDDWEYLCDLEKRAIVQFNTRVPHGYNLTAGGEGVVGNVLTEEALWNITAAQKRRYERAGERERLLEAGLKGRQVSQERHASRRVGGKAPWQVRKAQSALKAQMSPEEWKLEHGRRTRAHMARPEIKAKVVAAAKARAASPEWREKIGRVRRGVTFDMSPEWAKAIGSAQKNAWADPEKRAQRIAKNRATRAAKKSKENNQ